MSSIREKSLTIVLNILKGLDAQFCIILPDGTKMGDLEVQEKKTRARRPTLDGRKFGELAAYYKPFVQNMQPGEIIEVAYNSYRPDALAGSLTAWACNVWGKSSVITHKQAEHLEVMRVK